jgi:hypothetical protein
VDARREKHSRVERTCVRDQGEHLSNEADAAAIPRKISKKKSLAVRGISARDLDRERQYLMREFIWCVFVCTFLNPPQDFQLLFPFILLQNLKIK